jgi:hypothetical protein
MRDWTCSSTKGLQYNPITRRYWLSSDTSVNYLLATRRSVLSTCLPTSVLCCSIWTAP